jgi:hypothetical protein
VAWWVAWWVLGSSLLLAHQPGDASRVLQRCFVATWQPLYPPCTVEEFWRPEAHPGPLCSGWGFRLEPRVDRKAQHAVFDAAACQEGEDLLSFEEAMCLLEQRGLGAYVLWPDGVSRCLGVS